MPRLTIMCDGDNCAVASAPLRCYPHATFTLGLCEPCFEQEAKRARTIARALSIPDLWPVHDWATAPPFTPKHEKEPER